ncbi:hypothetical protein FDECE_12575 [Fusarium decemcellulare]|nr:hypothetical protein FDECE_12575 [Fusarium decemcellulare]
MEVDMVASASSNGRATLLVRSADVPPRLGVALAGNPLWGEVLLNDSDVCLELEDPGEYVTLKPAELYPRMAGQMANISAPPPIRVGYLQELPAFQYLAQEATTL